MKTSDKIWVLALISAVALSSMDGDFLIEERVADLEHRLRVQTRLNEVQSDILYQLARSQ